MTSEEPTLLLTFGEPFLFVNFETIIWKMSLGMPN